jgi:hypothetical protein
MQTVPGSTELLLQVPFTPRPSKGSWEQGAALGVLGAAGSKTMMTVLCMLVPALLLSHDVPHQAAVAVFLQT